MLLITAEAESQRLKLQRPDRRLFEWASASNKSPCIPRIGFDDWDRSFD